MHTTSSYLRSQILSYYDLTDKQKQDAHDYMNDLAEESSYVLCPTDPEGILPLSLFMKYDGGLWHGVMGLGYFSAYYIFLNRTAEEAVVSYRHW